MKKIFLILLMLTWFGVRAQNAGGDQINLKYALYGLELDTNTLWHQNSTYGYYFIVPTTTCVVDSITWIPGKKPVGAGVVAHRDTLRVGIVYPYPVYKIKLLKGKCLLYRNKRL